MVPTAGFEPVTLRLEGACSIQLSYVGIAARILYIILFFLTSAFFKYSIEFSGKDFKMFKKLGKNRCLKIKKGIHNNDVRKIPSKKIFIIEMSLQFD